MQIKSYKELIVWQKSIQFVKEIFILTSEFPKAELYGLVSQLRRAAISIPSNIAEGNGRSSRKEYAYNLSIAYGSALECEPQLIIAKELKFVNEREYIKVENLLNEILRMLNSMRDKMRSGN